MLNISHTTEYHFDTPPAYGLQQIRLTPKTSSVQKVHSWSITYLGAQLQSEFVDQNNNVTQLVRIDPDISCMKIKTEGVVEVSDTHGVVGKHGGFAPLWYFLRQTALTQAGPGVMKIADGLAQHAGTDLDRFHILSRKIAEAVAYEAGRSNATSTAEEALKTGAGVCQDHAHIFISVARTAGFPARYVSGYLMMNDRVDQDATHAWAEVHIPDLGWTAFDVSNKISPDARYVRVATGLDYSAAAPISGLTIGGSGESIKVDVQVQQQ